MKIWAWRNQEYLITNRRVIKSEGIFNKQMGDSSLEKVNDARLTQSWLGRIFDYGHLDIMTASEMAEAGMVNDFPMLAEPVKFKVAMLNQKERLEFPDLAPAPAQHQASAARDAAGRADGAARRLLPGVRGEGRRHAAPARTRRRRRLPPSPRRQAVGQATSRPGWRAWAGCATRASSPPRSTRRRSASCLERF